MEYIFAVIFGAIIGSFLSVCIYRIPRAESYYVDEETSDNPKDPPIGFTEPKRSICPKCRRQLLWWHNIPVISWFLLRGKCGFCKEPIPSRYVFVELLTVLTAVLTVYRYGYEPTAFVVFLFSCALIVITFIDYDYYIIPNVISYPGAILGLATATVNHFFGVFRFPVVPTIDQAFWGILAGAGFLLFISEVYLRLRKKEGLGLGDVKLLAMTGAFFGPGCSLFTIFVGSFVGSIIGFALIIFSRRKMTQYLPFGPSLALGTFLYLFTDFDFFFSVR